ncbi:MAG: BON domain-containing protein [Burkholderiaceae bacterium]|jgi:osmotically-inducible protein OsmY|nr:BON domain-containing protein [Burkholderiaceae bacterium]
MKTSFAVKALGALLLVSTLGACAPLMIAGVAGTAMVASDRRTSGAQLEDESIELRAQARIRDNLGERVHVNVTSFNRQVLLTGEVTAEKDRQAVVQLVERIENVKAVVNELAVMPMSNLSERSNDLLIVAKVKASFVDSRDLFANAFKVVTERGTVYLMGRVTQREANSATQLTRNVSGVNKVVRLFEIISEEELRNLLPPPPAPAEAAKPAK